jgi:hypothetical protein
MFSGEWLTGLFENHGYNWLYSEYNYDFKVISNYNIDISLSISSNYNFSSFSFTSFEERLEFLENYQILWSASDCAKDIGKPLMSSTTIEAPKPKKKIYDDNKDRDYREAHGLVQLVPPEKKRREPPKKVVEREREPGLARTGIQCNERDQIGYLGTQKTP